jgi:hypothetical protein
MSRAGRTPDSCKLRSSSGSGALNRPIYAGGQREASYACCSWLGALFTWMVFPVSGLTAFRLVEFTMTSDAACRLVAIHTHSKPGAAVRKKKAGPVTFKPVAPHPSRGRSLCLPAGYACAPHTQKPDKKLGKAAIAALQLEQCQPGSPVAAMHRPCFFIKHIGVASSLSPLSLNATFASRCPAVPLFYLSRLSSRFCLLFCHL